ncbi:MAG: hypothetical protein V3T83_09910, partial [Acidobacteriota bacterium]
MKAKRTPQARLLEELNGSRRPGFELKPARSGLGKARLQREGGPQAVLAVPVGPSGRRTEQKPTQHEEQLQIL